MLFRQGFTLMEVLVVAGITAILGTLLFATIQKSLGAGQAAKCVSNLRQAAMAYRLYANEHNGKFPENTTANANVSNPAEVSTIGSYVWKYPPSVLLMEGYVPNLDMFYCPAQKVYTYPDQSTDTGKSGFAKEGYYIGYRHFYLRDYTSSGKTGYPDYRNARVTDSPKVPLLMDMDTDASTGTPLNLHGDILNVAHLDGHVSQISSPKFLSLKNWNLKIAYIVEQN